jgi:hypothetical protein
LCDGGTDPDSQGRCHREQAAILVFGDADHQPAEARRRRNDRDQGHNPQRPGDRFSHALPHEFEVFQHANRIMSTAGR